MIGLAWDPMARTPAPLRSGGRLATTLWRRQLSAVAFRRLSAVAVVGLCLIIVTGAAVRLTGSGLGCPDWPTCADGNVVAPWQFHAWVEFGNRLVTVGLSVVCVLAALAALVRSTRRRDLTWLAFGLIGGLAAETVLGGITVLEKLAPPFVMAHFLLAVAFLADAVMLYHRAGLPEEPVEGRPGRARVSGQVVALVGRDQARLARLILVAVLVVITFGTLVTSTGPHGGSPEAPRFALSLHDVAQLHGSSADVLVLLVAVTLGLMLRSGVPASVLRRGEALLAAVVLQGAIGYSLYLLGDPAALTGLHVTGAVLVVLTVLRFNLGLAVRTPLRSTLPARPAGGAVTVPGAARAATAPAPAAGS